MEHSAQGLVIGADHAGFQLKERIVAYLKEKGVPVEDVGCFNTDRVDYPDIAGSVVRVMKDKGLSRAILACGSGIGVSMAANRFPGIRAVVGNDLNSAKWSRLHNDANVLCLGGRIIAPELAIEILDVWLNTPFEGGRHQGRVEKMDELANHVSATGEKPQQCSI